MTGKKKQVSGPAYTVNITELVEVSAKYGAKRIKLDDIGLDIQFDGAVVHDPIAEQFPSDSIDTGQALVDNVEDTEEFDVAESMEIAEDTIGNSMLSNPEEFEELIKQGLDEKNQ